MAVAIHIDILLAVAMAEMNTPANPNSTIVIIKMPSKRTIFF